MVAFCGLGMSKGRAMHLNMAHCYVKVYIFYNKNNNIAVVMFGMISERYELHLLLIENLTDGTYL